MPDSQEQPRPVLASSESGTGFRLSRGDAGAERSPRGRAAMVAAVLFLSVAVMGLATFHSLSSQRHATASLVCRQAQDTVAQAVVAYRAVLDSADVRQAATVKAAAVEDPSLVDQLTRQRGLEESSPTLRSLKARSGFCSTDKSTADLVRLTFSYRSDQVTLTGAMEGLPAVARAVLTSQTEFSRTQMLVERALAQRELERVRQQYGIALGLQSDGDRRVIDDIKAQIARGISPQTAEDLRAAGQSVRTAWSRVRSGLQKANALVPHHTQAYQYDLVRQDLAVQPLVQAVDRFTALQAQAQAQMKAYQQDLASRDAAIKAAAEEKSAQAQAELNASPSGLG